MRVLITADTVGGIWTYARELVTGLLRHGVEVTLVSFGHIPEPCQLAWTEGLRNMTAKVNADGTVSLYAVTAQTDTNVNTGDGDPDRLVKITDNLAATTLPANESFTVVASSAAGTVFRGVALAPQ